MQRQGYLAALVDPRVIAAIQSGRHGGVAIAYVEWAGWTYRRVIADWTLVHDQASARALTATIAAAPLQTGPWTSISGAIDFALPMFAANDFEGARRVIDISGDGPNNSGRSVTQARDEAVAAGVTINGLPIVNERPGRFGLRPVRDLDLYYEHCVIGGPRAFVVVADDFKAFAVAIRRKLIIEIAGGRPPTAGGAARAESRALRRASATAEAPRCEVGPGQP